MAQKKAEYGSGPLFRAAGAVYGVMTADVLLVLANILLVLSPLLVALFAGSAQLAAGLVLVAFVPVGPSLVAAAYAFNRLLAGEDTGVFRDFVRGYRANFRQALAVWLPYLAVLAAVVVNLLLLPGTFDAGNPAPSAARVGLLVLGLLVATAGVTAMLLLSRFTFRTRDLYRLSLYCLGAQKRVSLGNAGILFITGFLLLATTASLLTVIAGLVMYLICLNSRPMLKFIEAKFTVADPAVVQAPRQPMM
ncbi:MAG TPA: YesL family protein [Arthrobacter sp.]|nr:YesL family protein [Arthrobacter sp.]